MPDRMETKSDNDKSGAPEKSASGNEEAPAGEEAQEQSAYDAAFEDEDVVAEAPRESRLPLIASLAALGLAIAALGAVIWLGRTPPAPGVADATLTAGIEELEQTSAANDAALQDLRARLDPLRQTVATIEERIAQLAAEDGVIAADLDALERRFSQQIDLIESIPARVASVERSVSTLRGISTGAQDAWLLAQAEYFLQVANAELELSRNPSIAEKALEMADERLLSVGDPGLTDVRRELSAGLRALEALDLPDIAGTTVTLASLSRVVDTLPIRRQLLTKRPEEGDATGPTDEDSASGTARAMATLKDAFSGILSVRRTDEEAQPLMAPEAVYFLRANLALQLQAARLALLTGEQPLFEQSLDDAAAWLREYYDTGSTPVRGALQTIDEIRDTAIVGELPDISESLRLLRQYIAFRDAGNTSESGNEPQQ